MFKVARGEGLTSGGSGEVINPIFGA